MAHNHNHTHDHTHQHTITNLNTAFVTGIVLNTIYVAAEAFFGFYYDSMGLLSDAGHNLSDVASLIIAMIAFRMARRTPTRRYTYGYRKITVQASLVNALLLCAAVGAILTESISKLLKPTPVDGDAIAWVAGVGVVINALTAWMFIRDKDRDLNVKGAYMHMAADALVSVGVVVSGIIIHFTGWYFIDPVIGIIIAVVIGWSTKGLLQESVRMSLDGVPEGIDYDSVLEHITSVPGVESVHHLHIWALSTTVTAMTAHVVISTPGDMDTVITAIRQRMHADGIDHCTVETETRSAACDEQSCHC